MMNFPILPPHGINPRFVTVCRSGVIPNTTVIYIMVCMSAICFMALGGLLDSHTTTWGYTGLYTDLYWLYSIYRVLYRVIYSVIQGNIQGYIGLYTVLCMVIYSLIQSVV